MNAKILIYPSGGGEKGYSLSINNNILTIETKELGIDNGAIVLKKAIDSVSKRLSIEQLEIAQNYISKIKKLNVQYKDPELALDTWVFKILFDNKSTLVVNSFLLSKSSTPSDIKGFIKYLISLSPAKIELKGFS